MAAPPEITLANLSGKYTMNKQLSDDPTEFYKLQGLGWVTRKTLSLVTVTLSINQYTDEAGPHIDIKSSAAGDSSEELLILDWHQGQRTDKLFGNLQGKCRFFSDPSSYEPGIEPCDDLSKKFLLGEILRDGVTASSFLKQDGASVDEEKKYVQVYAKNVDGGSSAGWTVEQVWGFEEVNSGQRRYTRRLVCLSRDGKKVERMRIVYDYLGSA